MGPSLSVGPFLPSLPGLRLLFTGMDRLAAGMGRPEVRARSLDGAMLPLSPVPSRIEDQIIAVSRPWRKDGDLRVSRLLAPSRFCIH